MKLRNLTIALALLVPATASAGPLAPTAALSNEVADLGAAYEAPITGSQPDTISTAAAAVTSSHYTYETTFTISLGSFVPNWQHPPRDEQQQPQPVPEPSTLLLVGSSLAIAAVRKARAARKHADIQ